VLFRSDLGPIRYIYSHRLNLGKIRREENILWSFAPHDVAIILRLVKALPTQVISTGGAYVRPEIADVTVTSLHFDSGVAAHIFVSWLNPFKEQKLVIVGSKSMVTFDDVRRELILHEHYIDTSGETAPLRDTGRALSYSLDEPLRIQCEAFLAAITSRQPPRADGQSALRVLRVLEAAQRSLATRGSPTRA
jgi:predicted dehydrogenase